jgi:predicted Zn-ribbon and HTH transcriptional regulator
MSIKSAVSRLYNCKFETAFEYIKRSRFRNDTRVLKAFEKASNDFGNCEMMIPCKCPKCGFGWGGNLIMKTSQRLAKMIGYRYDEKSGYFIKRG